MSLTQDRLKELLTYSPETGLFYWAVNRYRMKAGDMAGTPDKDGYRCITIDQNLYKAHRLAWFWVVGAWPKDQIDHIDGDKANNSFSNLREASHADNAHNRAKRGYYFDKRRSAFVAQINVSGRHYYLGQFDNTADASKAYNAFAEKAHGEFARAAL